MNAVRPGLLPPLPRKKILKYVKYSGYFLLCRQARSPAHPASLSMNTGPQRKHAAKIALQSKDWRAILFDFFFSTGYNREKRL
jgi:hypothetical protein